LTAAEAALGRRQSRRIPLFIATSPNFTWQAKLRLQRTGCEQAVRAVSGLRNSMPDVEFSCEDAGRSK